METKPKKLYKSPSTMVVKVNPDGVICQSQNNVMVWMLTDPYNINSNDANVEWDRGGYGAADEI